MTPSSRARISVDLRGLRCALLDQARARGVTTSDLVRGVLAEVLGAVDSDQRVLGSATHRSSASGRVRLSLRLTAEQARAITLAAKAAGLPTGDFFAGLVAGVSVLSAGANRTDHLAALIESSAEISTLSRNINHLTSLLRQGVFRAAQEYRPMLDTLADDLRGHLAMAAGVLADLQPRSGRAEAPRHPAIVPPAHMAKKRRHCSTAVLVSVSEMFVISLTPS